jgi:elongation factor 1-alpha
MAEKPHMNLVFIGHVDHGKSTAVGRILLDTGHIDQHTIDELKKEAAKVGKATFEFAFVMDRLKEERERGITIDVAHKEFKSDKYYFTIIDAPGHRDFVKNMITGTSQADAAVLIVSGPDGIMEQTKEHMYLAKVLGVGQMVVAVNKMDATKPEYDEKLFNQRKDEINKMMKNVGWKDEQFSVLPISAYKGDNIFKGVGKLSWWKGDSLVGALNKLKDPPKITDKPVRIPIQDVYTITGIGTVPVGRVECGILKPDTKVIFMPSNKTGEVKTIEMHHQQMPQAVPGDNVGMNVRGIAKTDIHRGDVLGPADSPPTVAKSFTAQIMVLNHPSVIAVGYTPVFHCHTAQVACTFTELTKLLDPKTGQAIVNKEGQVKDGVVQFLKAGDAAVVKIQPTRPMVIETKETFPALARFAIRDMGATVAAGICIAVEKKEM